MNEKEEVQLSGGEEGEGSPKCAASKPQPAREPDYDWGEVLGEGTFGQVR